MRFCILLILILVIQTIKVLADSGTFLFCKMPAATMLIKIFVDFLYRLKDRYPYSNSEKKDYIDLFYIIMEFLIPNGYLPSAALLKEYSESKVTIKLSTLPTREYLNSKFSKYNQMGEEVYERLRKRLDSKPPFVFYFNPNIQLQEKVEEGWILKIGFFAEETDVSVNKWNKLLS